MHTFAGLRSAKSEGYGSVRQEFVSCQRVALLLLDRSPHAKEICCLAPRIGGGMYARTPRSSASQSPPFIWNHPYSCSRHITSLSKASNTSLHRCTLYHSRIATFTINGGLVVRYSPIPFISSGASESQWTVAGPLDAAVDGSYRREPPNFNVAHGPAEDFCHRGGESCHFM